MVARFNIVSHLAMRLQGSMKVGQLNPETHAEQLCISRPCSFHLLIHPLSVPNVNDGTGSLIIWTEKGKIINQVFDGSSNKLVPLQMMKLIPVGASADDNCGNFINLNWILRCHASDFNVPKLNDLGCQKNWFRGLFTPGREPHFITNPKHNGVLVVNHDQCKGML